MGRYEGDGKEGETLRAHSSWMEFLTYTAGMPGMQDSLIWVRKRVERTDKSGTKPKKRREMKWFGERVEQQRLSTTHYCDHKDTQSVWVEGLTVTPRNKQLIQLQFAFVAALVNRWTVSGPVCGPRSRNCKSHSLISFNPDMRECADPLGSWWFA